MRNSYFNENTLDELIDEIEFVYQSDDRPWVIGYSGGKDSTVVLQLVFTMLLRLRPEERKQHVYVVSSDTLVENPLIHDHLAETSALINEAAAERKLPLTTHIVYPEPSNTFWANIIGRGFPTPRMNGTFRWCTDRLKIVPSSRFIENIVETQKTEVVVLLGVRKDESIVRRRRIEGREIMGRLLNRHETIKDAWVYPPIVELTTDDVWDILLESNGGKTPWGSDNSRLVELYSDADSGECPFAGVVRRGEHSQTCGNSRFGCWVCPVVKEDKSLNGFIRVGHRELIPLADFRKWLMSIRDREEYREKKRRDGKVYTTADNELGFGPFTWEARQMILRELLRVQKKTAYQLITLEELKAIDKIWDDELDLSRRVLVELYAEEMGIRLPWDHLKKPLFDEETCMRMAELSEHHDVPYDLVRNLLLATTKNKYYSNPRLLRTSLEKALNQQWLHYEVVKELEDAYKPAEAAQL
jgi:DNA sulfur modification protein DndC